jgi:hypothetical protein
MATIPQYVTVMRNLQWDICKRLGVDMATATSTERALALSALAVQATLINLLVTKGVINDQELLAAVNAIRSSPWQPSHEPENPIVVQWNTDPVTGI